MLQKLTLSGQNKRKHWIEEQKQTNLQKLAKTNINCFCPSICCHPVIFGGRQVQSREQQVAHLGQETAEWRLILRPSLLGAQGRCWLLQESPGNEATALGRQAKWGLCL